MWEVSSQQRKLLRKIRHFLTFSGRAYAYNWSRRTRCRVEAEDSSDAPSPLPAHSPLGFGLLRQSYWRCLRKTPTTPKPYSERSPLDRKGSEDTSASPRVILPALLCGGLSLDSQVPTPPRRDAGGVTKVLRPTSFLLFVQVRLKECLPACRADLTFSVCFLFPLCCCSLRGAHVFPEQTMLFSCVFLPCLV